MYFYDIAPSRAKLGLAVMELSYTVGLVSKEMTGNTWNSTSRRIGTLWDKGLSWQPVLTNLPFKSEI